MVVKIDYICQLLPLNRISETVATVALEFKYSTHHLKFKEL